MPEVNEAVGNSVITIKASNPSAEDMAAFVVTVQEQLGASVTVAANTFQFKKSVDKVTGVETVREPVDLAIPFLSLDGLQTILNAGGKGLELLFNAANQIILDQARELIKDTSLDCASLPLDKLAWDVIANLPKAQRGGGVPKELWDAFAINYIEVMQEAAGKTLEQASAAARIFTNKLVAVRSNEAIINKLVGQLAIYAESTEQLEVFQPVVEFLLNKAEMFLQADDSALLESL